MPDATWAPVLSRLIGLLLVLAAISWLRRLLARGGPRRFGPWPGLTGTGGLVLLGQALLLDGGLFLAGAPAVTGSGALPMSYVPPGAGVAAAVWVATTRLVSLPGAVAGVTGAALLPWAVLSLAHPSIAPPVLLLPSAFAMDLVLWVRREHLHALLDAWPWASRQAKARRAWLARPSRSARPGARRIATAATLSGLLFGMIEPPYAALFGSAAVPAGPQYWLVTVLAAGAAGAAGWVALNASR